MWMHEYLPRSRALFTWHDAAQISAQTAESDVKQFAQLFRNYNLVSIANADPTFIINETNGTMAIRTTVRAFQISPPTTAASTRTRKFVANVINAAGKTKPR